MKTKNPFDARTILKTHSTPITAVTKDAISAKQKANHCHLHKCYVSLDKPRSRSLSLVDSNHVHAKAQQGESTLPTTMSLDPRSVLTVDCPSAGHIDRDRRPCCPFASFVQTVRHDTTSLVILAMYDRFELPPLLFRNVSRLSVPGILQTHGAFTVRRCCDE